MVRDQIRVNLFAGLLALGLCVTQIDVLADTFVRRDVTVSPDLDISLKIYPAKGNHVLLWLAPDFGFKLGHEEMATPIQQQGIEIWFADLTEALFMRRGSNSMRQLDGRHMADLLQYALKNTDKQVSVVSEFYGAIPILRGIQRWQTKYTTQDNFNGILLFSPSLYPAVPPLGQKPEYLPIVHATNMPIAIFQGARSPNHSQLESLLTHLRNAGSQVYTFIMLDVVSLFYREAASDAQAEYAHQLPNKLHQALTLLQKTRKPQTGLSIKDQTIPKPSRLDTELKLFRANMQPIPFTLENADGSPFTLDDFKGKVTVVNFWATWCPPCVKEIPSLNRLKAKMQSTPFELVSVNYGEDANTVNQFMQQVQVDFPVLLDVDGNIASKWNVIAFPSTFVIGPNGKIRYGVNAGIEWDTDEIIKILKNLQKSIK